MIPLQDLPGPRRTFPFVMLGLLVVNVLVFIFELSLGGSQQMENLVASAGVVPVEYTHGVSVGPPPPYGITWLTLITSMFLHADLLHIGSNMLYLFIFGDNVEDRLGHLRFLFFYFVCGIAAGLTHIALNANSTVPSIGASGAIAGVLASYLVLFPHVPVRTLIFFFPFVSITRVSATVLIGLWFVLQFLSGVLALGAPTDAEGGVAVWAHVGGCVAGFLLTQVMRPRGSASSELA